MKSSSLYTRAKGELASLPLPHGGKPGAVGHNSALQPGMGGLSLSGLGGEKNGPRQVHKQAS